MYPEKTIKALQRAHNSIHSGNPAAALDDHAGVLPANVAAMGDEGKHPPEGTDRVLAGRSMAAVPVGAGQRDRPTG